MNFEKKKYNQKRIFDVLFNPKKGKWILILLVCLILFETILFFFYKDSFNEKSLEYRIIEILLILLITTLYLFFHSPKCFYFDGKTIEFYNYKEKNQKNRDGTIKISFVVRRGLGFKKEKYILSELENVEFSQNCIEKIFNTGRLTFSGIGTCTVKRKTENITHKYKFTLYGIENFSDFKIEFLQEHQ